MAKFRTKPVDVNAMRWDGSRSSITACCAWVNGDTLDEPILSYVYQGAHDVKDVLIWTSEGDELVDSGDWIIKSGNGEFSLHKPAVVEVITFDELVEHGKANGANIINGMPWSFNYNGHPITHENDDCYLIPTLEGVMRFERGDVLITDGNGEICLCRPDDFAQTYEPAY